MAKILVFNDDTAENKTILEECLSKQHEPVFVTTTEDVIEKLDAERFDAVVANIYQETENVLGLLQRAKTAFWLTKVPFICLRGPDAAVIGELDETISMAMMLLGARGYVAANDYESIAEKLEKCLKAPTQRKKAIKSKVKVKAAAGKSGAR